MFILAQILQSTELYSGLMSAGGYAWGLLGLFVSCGVMLRCAFAHGIPGPAPFVIGWTIRVLFCIYNTLIYTFSVDAFELMAYELSLNPFGVIMSEFGTNSSFYQWFCAVIYYATGRSPLLLQAINIVFWSLSQFFIVKSVEALDGSVRAKKIVPWIYALFPVSIFYSTVILRESICIFGLAGGCYYWIRAQGNGALKYYLLCVAFFGFAALCHYGCVFCVLALVAYPYVRGGNRAAGAKRNLSFRIGVFATSFVLLYALFAGGILAKVAPAFDRDGLTVENVGGVEKEGVERGRTNYMQGLEATSLGAIIWTAPLRIIYFLFAPFPWMIRSGFDLVAQLDALIYLWIAYALVVRARRLARDYVLGGTLFICFVTMIVFAFGTVNYGTAMRHRGKFFPILLVAIVCLSDRAISGGGRRPEAISDLRIKQRRGVKAPGTIRCRG